MTPTQRVEAAEQDWSNIDQKFVPYQLALELATELERVTAEQKILSDLYKEEIKARISWSKHAVKHKDALILCDQENTALKRQVEELKREVNDVRQILTLADEEQDALRNQKNGLKKEADAWITLLGKANRTINQLQADLAAVKK